MLWLGLILLLLLPFIDLYILVELAGRIGFWNTMIIIIFTGLIGATIVKKEGINVLRKLQRSVTLQEVSRNMLEMVLLVLGGLMLLSPGLITDFLGLMCVWQPTRTKIMLGLVEKLKDKSNVRVEVQRF